MSGDRNKYGRAHISLIACSFVSINTLDKMRAGALIVRLFIMTRQASYPMTGREADRSLPRRMYYILWARSSSSSYSARGTPTRDPDSSQQMSKPIPYPIRAGSDAFLKFTTLQCSGSRSLSRTSMRLSISITDKLQHQASLISSSSAHHTLLRDDSELTLIGRLSAALFQHMPARHRAPLLHDKAANPVSQTA